MDNQTATACKKCKALIFYDRDGIKPTICPVCKIKEEKKAAQK